MPWALHGCCEAAWQTSPICAVFQGSIPKAGQGWSTREEAFAHTPFSLACSSRPRQAGISSAQQFVPLTLPGLKLQQGED